MLKIYNTITGKKQTLPVHKDKTLTLYVCGVTVYDDCHLGHARSAIIFDVLRNVLENKGLIVRYVKNYTDVDDKIIHRAQKEGQDWKAIGLHFIASYERDMARLGVRPPTLAPRATDHISDMTALIQQLISKNMAYPVEGNVYFKVTSFDSYGKLSRQKVDEMMAGARIEIDPRKKNPLDFVLWKNSKPGEPSWNSPWGPGRPGWHIECSAMAIKHLGETIDLHGGGEDLIFPHHENEIAQSEASTGKTFSSHWIHHGFVTINREKMSKSLGNFFTIDEIFRKSAQFPEKVTAEVLRFYLLSTHYRSPIDFSDQSLRVAKNGLDNFYTLFQKVDEVCGHERDHSSEADLEPFQQSFDHAMDDDLNTPRAIATLQTLRAGINGFLNHGKTDCAEAACKRLQMLGKCLGIFQIHYQDWRFQSWHLELDRSNRATTSSAIPLSAEKPSLSEEGIQSLIEEREIARQEKNWARSDQLRDQLSRAGVVLEDRPDGTTRIKR
ncbi:cysteine--tRNA ligase [Nitrospira defluvii]|nr:cysteine--tRNA ligase [Nitrospira defluvii]